MHCHDRKARQARASSEPQKEHQQQQQVNAVVCLTGSWTPFGQLLLECCYMTTLLNTNGPAMQRGSSGAMQGFKPHSMISLLDCGMDTQTI
jgi:hypothetical protein